MFQPPAKGPDAASRRETCGAVTRGAGDRGDPRHRSRTGPAASRARRQADGTPVEDFLDLQLRRRMGEFRLSEFLLREPQGKRAGEPQRPVVRGFRQAGAVGELCRTPRRAVRQSQRGWRAHVWLGAVVAGGDFSSFQVEDLSVGWRSGTTLESLGENAVELIVGRAQYQLGMASCSRRQRRGRLARRLLEQRAQGVRVCRDWPRHARCSHGGGLLPGQGRAARERLGQPALGREL